MLLAATRSAVAFIEIGAVVLALSVLARLAAKVHVSPIPLYLVAGLIVGVGGVVPLDVSADFIELAGDIGVLLLLLALGLEYSGAQLRAGLKTGGPVGLLDIAVCFTPGFIVAIVLGWDIKAALLLGGATWISSSGVASKVLADLGNMRSKETPAILNVLVLEDLAVAVYLPIIGALIASNTIGGTVVSVAVALIVLALCLTAAIVWGDRLSHLLHGATDESLLLAVFGLTLLVGGLAEQIHVSAAIGAFLVGVALSGAARERAQTLVHPLRDLFAATFFVFFSFGVDPSTLPDAIIPVAVLVIVTVPGKLAVGWVAAARAGVEEPKLRLRAGTTLLARGEFSIIIAALGASLADADALAAIAGGYVLVTTAIGPIATRLLTTPTRAMTKA